MPSLSDLEKLDANQVLSEGAWWFRIGGKADPSRAYSGRYAGGRMSCKVVR